MTTQKTNWFCIFSETPDCSEENPCYYCKNKYLDLLAEETEKLGLSFTPEQEKELYELIEELEDPSVQVN